MHDSFTPLGGGMTLMINMMLGEVAPGGVGSGLYGMLVLAVIAVFVAGLMVGRTPEYLGKKIGAREIKLASLYILATPALVLVGTGGSRSRRCQADARRRSGTRRRTASPRCSTPSPRRRTTTAPRSPGITANTAWFNTALGVAMLARPVPADRARARASPARSPRRSTVPGDRRARCRRTGRSSSACSSASIVIVTALTYFPVLALGPLAEGLH